MTLLTRGLDCARLFRVLRCSRVTCAFHTVRPKGKEVPAEKTIPRETLSCLQMVKLA